MTDLELGIANCRAKLAAHSLLRFVDYEEGSRVGAYHFHLKDAEAFRAALVERGFTVPGRAPEGEHWQSRERVAIASLHIKHFEDWPATKVQAHIDPHGVGGAWRWLRHVLDYSGYMDVRRIERLLTAQGLGPSAP